MNISLYRQSLKKKGWYVSFKEARKRLCPIYWVQDIAIREQIMENRAYRFLKKKYLPEITAFTPQMTEEQQPSKIIWVCWLQGEDNAPPLVKRCISSMRQYAGDNKVIVLSNDNISQYVNIPEYIKEHLRKKHMQMSQYTDYLRTALLVKHGGIWIDSTVLLTSPLPDYITSSKLFCYQKSPLSLSHIKASSWLIAARKNNIIMQQLQHIFEYYWQKENRLRHYFIYHLLLSIIIDGKDINTKEWNKMPYINNVDVHLLQFNLFKPYSEDKWNHLCSLSGVHKLTYKFHNPNLPNRPGTNYRHIID